MKSTFSVSQTFRSASLFSLKRSYRICGCIFAREEWIKITTLQTWLATNKIGDHACLLVLSFRLEAGGCYSEGNMYFLHSKTLVNTLFEMILPLLMTENPTKQVQRDLETSKLYGLILLDIDPLEVYCSPICQVHLLMTPDSGCRVSVSLINPQGI